MSYCSIIIYHDRKRILREGGNTPNHKGKTEKAIKTNMTASGDNYDSKYTTRRQPSSKIKNERQEEENYYNRNH